MEVVRLTKETTYGTYASANPHQDIFLPVGNAMTVRVKPSFWRITDASRGNRNVRANVARKPVNGTLQTYLFPSQAAWFMDMATGLVGSDPCYDLPSFTIDHALYADGCLAVYKRYLGCKIGQFTLSADQTDQGCLVSVNAQIVGSTVAAITSTDLPAQALTAYPSEDPYLFFGLAGNLTVNTSRTDFQNVNLTVSNVTKAFMGEQQFSQKVRYFGRTVTFASKFLYKATTDRTAYEAGTKQAVSFSFTDGTNTLAIDLKGKNNIEGVEDDIPLDDFAMQSINLLALVDPTAGTDLSYTVTP
jgi:uncharacterized membrane protein YeaQ/YmgE (transglycosylase-associated protein family)